MFVTTNIEGRKPIFAQSAYAREAIDVLYRTQDSHAFLLFGFVFMPDHCHLLMKVSAPDTISATIRTFKVGVTFSIGIGPLWQPRFHLMIPKNPWRALAYISLNPVRAGLVTNPTTYPWSSASGRWDISRLE